MKDFKIGFITKLAKTNTGTHKLDHEKHISYWKTE